VTDFSDFLTIPGCTWSTHSDEKRVVVPLETAPKPSVPLAGPTSSSDGVEKYGHARSAAFKENAAASAAAAAAAIAVAPMDAVEERDPLDEPDADDAVIAVDAPCLHRGCNASYVDANSRQAECFYHPGRPVFHDMSKGWSCCRRKVLEFDDFLKIEGCTSGRHKFVPPPRPAVAVVEFRYDFFQSVPKVTVSVYCKNADKQETRVEFRADSITWHVVGPDGQIADKTLQLAERIKPSECSFAVLSTKVELRLVKEEGVQWTTLERQ
jgi:hypothetical protein